MPWVSMIGSRPSKRAYQGNFFAAGASGSVWASQSCASSYSRATSFLEVGRRGVVR